MRKQKPNIAIIAALVLLCLVMVSTSLTSGLYAKFISRGAGEDSARVAAFDVQVTPLEPKEITLTNVTESEKEYEFTMISRSEVAVSADVIVTFDINKLLDGNGYLSPINQLQLNSWLSDIKLEGEEGEPSFSDGEYKITFAGVHEFAALPTPETVNKKFSFKLTKAFYEALKGDGYATSESPDNSDDAVYAENSTDRKWPNDYREYAYDGYGLDYNNDIISIAHGELPFTVSVKLTQID